VRALPAELALGFVRGVHKKIRPSLDTA